ncbi:unnamed protein product [Closterium sp. Yama58-4]|nr:unnamed protein product [Closterium sp. Yama58-4]
MAEREMRAMVESAWTMLLHISVQHHRWHLALRQAVWVRNCLERSATPGTTPYQLLTGTKPDLSLARVWGCMAQFLVPEQQRGGKLKPKVGPSHRRVGGEQGADAGGHADGYLDSNTTAARRGRWKGSMVKAAMEGEIRSLINMGTCELIERPPGVNIMKNPWMLTIKYHIDDTVEREKTRLVVKGFTQVYGADYDKTFAPVGSYVTLRIFLSIVAVLNLNLMQLDMKNAFLQSKLDRVLYMYQPDYFNDGTGRVCKLLKSLYGLKQSPLLWYLALNDVLVGAGWKKSQVDEALYFKVGEFLPVQKYLGLEIVRDRSTKKLWLHQQGYTDKLRRRFIDEEQGGRTPKTPVSVDAYAELTFNKRRDARATGGGKPGRRSARCCSRRRRQGWTSPSPAASWGVASW